MNKRCLARILVLLIILSSLTGCSSSVDPNAGSDANNPAVSTDATETPDASSTPSSSTEPETTTTPESSTEPTEEPDVSVSTEPENLEPTTEPEDPSGLDETQLNSIRMLNYLTVLSQEINSSNNSRIFLESAYSSLINNTYPNAVDVRTEAHMEDLLDTLESFRMLTVKRERLEYIYEQNRAQALKAAIPNPMGLLSVVQSGQPLKSAISVIYMAVDSYSSYTAYTAETDLQYLQDGWELDDAAATEVHNTRTMTFSYMLDMVRSNDLPGDYALNEDAVTEFVSWKNNSNVSRRIRFFESNQETYQAFGEYWLALAESYYENGDYEQCLEAVHQYEEINARIFRKDYGYAKALPLAIVSAREIYEDDEYIAVAAEYLPIITKNTDISDWAICYFVAQTYVDLYAKTTDVAYLESAYNLMTDVVNDLIDEQRELNDAYLADVEKEEIPDDAEKDEKKEIEQYNKMLEETRKTELPPISEPLRICSEMMFALADELDIDDDAKEEIEKMLHEDGQDLFLNQLIDANVRFYADSMDADISNLTVGFDGKKIKIPAMLVSSCSKIVVTISDGSDKTVIEDWVVKEVKREDDTLESFVATFESETAKDFDYKADMSVSIEIYAVAENTTSDAAIEYDVVGTKTLWVFDSVAFERVVQ